MGSAVRPVGSARRIVIPVTGMTCAACQARVQRTLLKAPGVGDATVNLMMNSASVSFDPTATTPQALVDAIMATGYGASLPAATDRVIDEQGKRDRAQLAEFQALRFKAIVSGTLGAVAMGLSDVLRFNRDAVVYCSSWRSRP